VSAWKPMSLCLLLILSLVSAVAASPAPSHASNTASAASVAAAASAAAPLWAPGAQTVACAGEAASADLPVLGARTCSLRFCSGTGGCVCSNGQHGTCSGGLCVQ
jgi:hypothetical protein